jgi:hypothetical protein
MIRVGKNRKRELEFFRKLTALVLIVDAYSNNLSAGSGELIVISGQTGQLFSAIRSPIAAVEH